jgi:hypothetical protein
MASPCKILCPKCIRIRPKTAHHIFPKEFWGEQPNGPFLFLCEACHAGIQKLVHYPSLTKRQILDITAEWLCYEE